MYQMVALGYYSQLSNKFRYNLTFKCLCCVNMLQGMHFTLLTIYLTFLGKFQK